MRRVNYIVHTYYCIYFRNKSCMITQSVALLRHLPVFIVRKSMHEFIILYGNFDSCGSHSTVAGHVINVYILLLCVI